MLHGGFAQVRIDAALDNREKRLGIAVKRLSLIEMAYAAFQPVLREFQRLLRLVEIGVTGAALVQSHYDVGTDDALGVHIVFRRENMFGPVNM